MGHTHSLTHSHTHTHIARTSMLTLYSSCPVLQEVPGHPPPPPWQSIRVPQCPWPLSVSLCRHLSPTHPLQFVRPLPLSGCLPLALSRCGAAGLAACRPRRHDVLRRPSRVHSADNVGRELSIPSLRFRSVRFASSPFISSHLISVGLRGSSPHYSPSIGSTRATERIVSSRTQAGRPVDTRGRYADQLRRTKGRCQSRAHCAALLRPSLTTSSRRGNS